MLMATEHKHCIPRTESTGVSILRHSGGDHDQRHRHVQFREDAEAIDADNERTTFRTDFNEEQNYTVAHDGIDDDDLCFMARAPRPHRSPSSTGSDSDFETHLPSSPSSFDDIRLYRSMQVYDLHGNFGRGRVQVRPPEAT